ncbi:hypothetical protein JHK87_041405 [Glycine soja]|nr:hypothetical protein JHK87_041405 [Glycine soja]
MARETIEKVRDDVELEEELEMLLDEIPHATSHNLLRYHHHHRHGHGDDDGGAFVTKQTQYGHGHGHGMYYDDDFKSPISGFFLQSDGSSSSLFSSSPPPFEDLKSSVASRSSYYPNTTTTTTTTNNNSNLFFDSKIPDSTVKLNEAERTRSPIAPAAEINSALSGLTQDHKIPNLFGSSQQPCTGWREHDSMVSQLNGFSAGSMDSLRRGSQLMNDYHFRGGMAPELVGSLSRSPAFDSSFYAQKYAMNLLEERGGSRLPNNSFCGNFKPCVSVQELLQYGLFQPNPNARGVPLSNARIPQGNLDAITSEGSFIIQGEGLNYVGVSRGSDHSWCQRAVLESGFAKQLPRSELDIQHQITGYENPRSPRNACSFPLLPNYNSLAEAQGLIYLIAKDQHGCRFLQRIFDEGTPEDVQVIFNEIIDHVVELMMNPFGNYLMQKLLDVCDENQRMQMILMVTEEPGQLVRISLNTHGTRVVQKVIETLKTRQQISLVVAALEPGFLALIKDLNGNHVVQHCLQCLSNEDNKFKARKVTFPILCIEQFIFVAAAKYCVDIATHQHGCCVLQRCIGHSRGEHREKLVEEISANALLLAQDQFGNYVVQFILDLRIPSATATLSLQFEGKYVHLSMQKFGSHVVEKCLAVFNDENRSRVIHELLSAPHFEQLLQDPHANYVIQSAVRHSEGHVHNLLVEAIESHKAISRNSPYSKKIFSQKLLKK